MLRQAARHGATSQSRPAPDDTAWTRPLLFFWISALTPLAALPGFGRPLSVLVFVIVDLRWWWTLVIAVLTLLEIYRKVYGEKRGREPFPSAVTGKGSRPLFRFAPEAALVAICAVWVIAGTPNLRFSAATHGDEPKYLRHCENFYQGHGFEISSIRPIAELPPDFTPRLGRNLTLVARTLPRELESLATDIGVWFSDPSHRFVRSSRTFGFIKGKSGGVYQLHQPGLSLMMMPAYYIDRQLAIPEPGSNRQWPSRLYAVNTFFLVLYLLCVIFVYRFAIRLTASAPAAWMTALTMGLTLPLAAFPFQFYSELAAGVVLFGIAGHLLFSARSTTAAALFFGLLTGYLPWLHVRFSALAAVLAVFAIMKMRRQPRRLAAYMLGCLIPLVLLSLYAYRLTGSILPSAVYNEEDGGGALSVAGAVRGSVAYLIDSQWGLFAHSPILLLALPGYYWLMRQQRQLAGLCVLVFLSVLIPSAAHTLHGAATTPSRLIVGVVPFAALPLAIVIARYGRSRAFQALFSVLLLVSAQNALAYNMWHVKHVGPMVDRSYSGWKVNLLFPAQSRTPWMTDANGWLYVAWIVILIAAVIGPAVVNHLRTRGVNLRGLEWSHLSVPRALLALAGLIVLLGTGVAAATGAWEIDDYREPHTARARLAAQSLDETGGCLLCLSSASGRIGTDQALDQLVTIDPALGGGAARDYKEWLEMPARIRAWHIEANGREPSNGDMGHYLYQWREEQIRPDEIRRRIFRAAAKPGP